MNFNIRMGIPEMQELWLDLQEKYRSGNIKKKDRQIQGIQVFKPMK